MVGGGEGRAPGRRLGDELVRGGGHASAGWRAGDLFVKCSMRCGAGADSSCVLQEGGSGGAQGGGQAE